jgi:hypothetical protein
MGYDRRRCEAVLAHAMVDEAADEQGRLEIAVGLLQGGSDRHHEPEPEPEPRPDQVRWRRSFFRSNEEYGAYIMAELTRGVRLAASLRV